MADEMTQISRQEFLESVTLIAGSVYDFHNRFGIPAISINGSSDAAFDRLRTRLAFLIEESGEHSRELNQGNLRNASEELADVAFVAMGTLLELNELGAQACQTVAAKNNGKTQETHYFDAGSGKLIKRAVLRPEQSERADSCESSSGQRSI